MALVSRARGSFYGRRAGGAPHRRAVFIGFGPLAGGAAGARERSLKSSHFVAPHAPADPARPSKCYPLFYLANWRGEWLIPFSIGLTQTLGRRSANATISGAGSYSIFSITSSAAPKTALRTFFTVFLRTCRRAPRRTKTWSGLVLGLPETSPKSVGGSRHQWKCRPELPQGTPIPRKRHQQVNYQMRFGNASRV